MAVFATPEIGAAGSEARLGGPDGRGLWIGEDDTRESFIVGFARLAQDVRGDDVGLVLAGRGQRPDAGDVADRPQPVAGAQTRVDGDPVAVRLDADRFEPDVVHPRPAAGRNEQPVTPQLGAVVKDQDVVVAVTPRLRRAHAEQEVDAVAAENLTERITQRSGFVGEHALGHVGECDVGAEAANGLRHLDADRATAQDQQATGNRRHRGHLAVRPHPLELPQTGNRRHERGCAGGHHDVPGRVARAADFDGARPREPAAAAQHFDAPVGQPLLGALVRVVRDHVVTPGERRGDIDLGIHRRLVRVVGSFTGPKQGLGRDARPVGTLATNELTFDDGNSQAALRQRAGTVLARARRRRER